MKRIRVIPVLLIKDNGLVKSVQFKKHKYVGDPINAVKIFNEKEVDELAILDISASANNKAPDIERIAEIGSEAFMPVSYGGGITTFQQVKDILFSGIEKVVINKSAHVRPELISKIADAYGAQSMVVSIDVKTNWLGKYKVYTDNGTVNTDQNPVEFAKKCESLGAGEILLNSIDRDGTYKGYDTELLKAVSSAVNIPVVICGGASDLEDFKKAVADGGASAVSAGSMFVFQRPHNAVLISYPSQQSLKDELYSHF
ncbi:MAG TPA: AglZ/HisF2 family acetamidino modification protein [Chitinophagaceae bacterium]|nr:AglZ/HisF2 family acetamidino modification protein [Chitinophagaceae bacterium]